MQRLLAAIRQVHPEAHVERLTVTNPGDDDNVWFIRDGSREVQVDCWPEGALPFLVESDSDERVEAADVETALYAVKQMMRW